MKPQRAALESLTRRVRVLERGSERPERPPLATGWAGVDGLLGGGLARGVVHEWLGLDGPRVAAGGGAVGGGAFRAAGGRTGAAAWTPPLFLLAHLARRALAEADASAGGGADGAARWILWIGRRVWPYPRTLTRGGGLVECAGALAGGAHGLGGATPLEGARCALELDDVARSGSGGGVDRAVLDRSLFVDPPDRKGLLWAVDAALRCPTVAAVVADGSNLPLPASRRLQLAAEAGSGLCLLARPANELRQLSAAATRWHVRRGGPSPEDGPPLDSEAGELSTDPADRPRWDLELLRCRAGLARVARAPTADGMPTEGGAAAAGAAAGR